MQFDLMLSQWYNCGIRAIKIEKGCPRLNVVRYCLSLLLSFSYRPLIQDLLLIPDTDTNQVTQSQTY